MPLLSKTVATLASAVLLTTGSVAVAAGAQARPGHAGHTGHPVSRVHKSHDKLAGPRKGASHAIAAQLKAVRSLATKAGTLTTAHATELQGVLATDLAAVQADLAAVSSATSVKALRTLTGAANTARQVAGAQFRSVTASDALGVQAGSVSDLLSTVQALLAALPADTTIDVAAVQAILDQVTQALPDVQAQLDQIVAEVLALAPDAARTDLHAALDAIGTALPVLSAQVSALLTQLTDAQTTVAP